MQAVEDYRYGLRHDHRPIPKPTLQARRRRIRHPYSPMKSRPDDETRRENMLRKRFLLDCVGGVERFFRSVYFSRMTTLSGEELIRRLREEAGRPYPEPRTPHPVRYCHAPSPSAYLRQKVYRDRKPAHHTGKKAAD